MSDMSDMSEQDLLSLLLSEGKKYGGRLESWTIMDRAFAGPAEDDEDIRVKFGFGYIYEDPARRWPDGSNMRTSMIQDVYEDLGYIVTRNSIYKLGEQASSEVAEKLTNGFYA